MDWLPETFPTLTFAPHWTSSLPTRLRLPEVCTPAVSSWDHSELGFLFFGRRCTCCQPPGLYGDGPPLSSAPQPAAAHTPMLCHAHCLELSPLNLQQKPFSCKTVRPQLYKGIFKRFSPESPPRSRPRLRTQDAGGLFLRLGPIVSRLKCPSWGVKKEKHGAFLMTTNTYAKLAKTEMTTEHSADTGF